MSDTSLRVLVIRRCTGNTVVISSHISHLRRYFICHFTSDINELLQELHDVAEDRVVRGMKLNDSEVSFISVRTRPSHRLFLHTSRQDLTALYNMLFSDVYPAFLRQADGDVVAVRDAPPPTPPRARAVRASTINSVMDGDEPTELPDLYAALFVCICVVGEEG
jgi:hypothetical protein